MITTIIKLKKQWYQIDFLDEYKCVFCKAHMQKPIARFPNIFSGEFLVHVLTTHGLKPKQFIKMFEENIIKDAI